MKNTLRFATLGFAVLLAAAEIGTVALAYL